MADERSFSLKDGDVPKPLAPMFRVRGRTYRRRRAKASGNRPHVLLDPDYINLLKWAKNNGVVYKRLRPAIFQETGRGMVTTKNIKNGENIISVPVKLLLTPETAMKSVIGAIYRKSAAKLSFKLSNKCLLCVYLVYVRYLGNKSFWYPYMRTLPSEFNTPCFFNEFELQLLPMSCYNASLIQIDQLKKAFECVRNFSRYLEDFDVSFSSKLTFDSFRWAWFVINTRSVYLLDFNKKYPGYQGDGCHCDNFALAPVLDLLNHNDMAEMLAGINKSTNTYTITTITEYHRGNQVFINYGPHDNNTLLIEYGFILPKNIHNSVKIDPGYLYHILNITSSPTANKKFELIRRNNLEKDFSFCYENEVSWNLLTALRILAFSENEMSHWTRVFYGQSQDFANEGLVGQWINLIVSSELEMLAEKDHSVELGSSLTTNIRLAVELRRQAQDILKSILKKQQIS